LKPYNREYILEKNEEYLNIIDENKINEFKIEISDKVKFVNGYMYDNAIGTEMEYISLKKNDQELMKLSPMEIQSSYNFIKFAKGRVGIVGLGLGYVVQELLKKEEVEEIVVYEIEKDIIYLYINNFGLDKRVKFINKNAFEAKSEKFDFFYVDFYYYKLDKIVTEDYKRFKKLHDIKNYMFWGMEHFLLSCRYEEIVWVYIPELWMESSKETFAALQENYLLKNYKQLDENLVRDILAEFKVIFDEEE